MSDHSQDKIHLDTERLRIRHAFWLSIFGLSLAAVLTILLISYADAEKKLLDEPADIVAIVGLFTSVTGTLVGALVGHQIGAAGAEHERRSREAAEEHRQRAEEVTRRALAHLNPDTAKEVLSAAKGPPVS
jgi:lysylphosphatidylglycerol synthetase-like protein (DUF2156 family)